jgi:PPOX class probable F420-dependent enzyme
MGLMDRLTERTYARTERERDAQPRAVRVDPAADLGVLAAHRFTVLVTFASDGTPMPETVWGGVDAQRCFYVRSSAHAEQAVRVAENPHVQLFASDRQGAPRSAAIEGRARILAPPDRPRAEAVLTASGGVLRRLHSALLGRPDAVYIEIVRAER